MRKWVPELYVNLVNRDRALTCGARVFCYQSYIAAKTTLKFHLKSSPVALHPVVSSYHAIRGQRFHNECWTALKAVETGGSNCDKILFTSCQWMGIWMTNYNEPI